MLRVYIFLLLFMSTEESGAEIDLVFALHTPSVMSAADLSYTVDFLYEITSRLTIGTNNSLVAVLTYSKYVTQHFNLSAYPSKEQLLPALLAVKSANRTNEESKPNEVLDSIRTQIFSNSRTTSTKVVLLTLLQGPQISILTEWAADDLSSAYGNALLTVGLDSLTESDKTLLKKIAKDDSRAFYVSDFKYSCHIVPNVTNLIDSAADTSLVDDCPDPYATEITTVAPSTKDDSILLVVIGAIIGTLILLVGLIIAFKCAKGNAEKDLRVLRAIEVYGEARLGTSKGSFCNEDLGKSEDKESTNRQRLALARNFSNCYVLAWHKNR